MFNRRVMSIFVVMFFCISFCMIPMIQGDDRGIIYVDDDRDPSWYDATHVKTIQEGVNNASVGDTVYVFSGVYYENVDVNKNDLTIVSESRNDTIIDGMSAENCFKIKAQKNIYISKFTLINGTNGLFLENCFGGATNNEFTFFTIYNCSASGVYLYGNCDYNFRDNHFSDFLIYQNGRSGFRISTDWYYNPVEYNTFEHSTVHSNDKFGVEISGSGEMRYNSFRFCTFYNNSKGGFNLDSPYFYDIRGTEIINCTCYHNGGDGINASGHDKIILNCTSYNNTGYGLVCNGDTSLVNHCVLIDNQFDGIKIIGNENTIVDCSCVNNSIDGIEVLGSNCLISNCDVSKNQQKGMHIQGNSNTLINCSASFSTIGGFYFQGDNPSELRSIEAWQNQGFGCKLYDVNSFTLSDVYVHQNADGLLIDTCSDGVVCNVTAYDNLLNQQVFSTGIGIDSSSSIELMNVTCEQNYHGVSFIECSTNNLSNSYITNNLGYGVYSFFSDDNIIYNNFIDNTNNSFEEFSTTGNTWNVSKHSGSTIVGGDFLGGNYWSDYTGVDLNLDGLGDSPYPIPGGSRYDYLPLFFNNTVELGFKIGWNLITIPFCTEWYASTLAENISGCEMISWFDAENQTYRTYIVGSSGYDFKILNGKGYFVLVNTESVLAVNGNMISHVSLPVEIGWNCLGWFQLENTTASSLSENISGCSMVSFFDAVNQTYKTHVVGGSGYDFIITRGMGVFVYTDQKSTWYGD